MADSPYSPQQRRLILRLARAALVEHFGGVADELAAAIDDPALIEPRGCFVTLRNRGALRGCVGTFDAAHPLGQAVIRMAASAAQDPRFDREPVTAAELEALTIEVSVLTPMVRIEDHRRVRIGVDGVYLRRTFGYGAASGGCFLPEVAVEQGWDVETTLSMCCSHKMRLPPDAWRTLDDMELYVFQSIKLSEQED